MKNALPVHAPHSDRGARARRRQDQRVVARIKRRVAKAIKGNLHERLAERAAATEDQVAKSIADPSSEL